MKKITLCTVNARYTHSNLALLCLRAAAKPGPDIRIVETSINDSVSVIVNRIAEGEPDAVGFSCYLWNIGIILKAASDIKKILPGCFLFLGGPEVSHDSRALMEKHGFIDMVIRGAGELPFAHFAERFEDGRDVSATPSADIRCGNKIITNDNAPPLDMNLLPFVYDDLTKYDNKIIYYETSRGCPYHCAYCMSANDDVSLLPAARVKRELEYFIRAGVRQVKLVDRTFNYPRDRAYELFEALIGLSERYPRSGTGFHFEISACLLDERMLELLKTAPPGLLQLEIGIQSTHPATLEAVGRRQDVDKLLQNTRAICAMGNIHVHVDLIAGLPYESYEIFQKSFNDAYALGAQQLQLGFLKVLKGSPMQSMAERYDIRYSAYPPYEVLSTHVMSYQELVMLHRIEQLVESMHNTGHFMKTLAYIIAGFKSPFEFYEQLAHFLLSREYFTRMQKKQTLFELVLSFARETGCGDVKVIEEALMFDWLSLEKSRSWPKGLEPVQTGEQRSQIRELYRNREWVAEHLPALRDLSGPDIARRCELVYFEHLFGEKRAAVFTYGGRQPIVTII